MNRWLLFFVLLLVPLRQIWAAEPAPRSSDSVRGGIEFLYVQGPAFDRQDRYSFFMSFHHFFESYLRGEAYLFISPDGRKKSGDVGVYEDFYSLVPALAGAYTYLFRYTCSVGPLFMLGNTTYELKSKKKSFSFYETGVIARLGLEYAFNDFLELNGAFGYQYRFEQKKLDYMYGLSLAYYF